MKLPADTSALLALMLRDDQNHKKAAAFVRERPRLTDCAGFETMSHLGLRSEFFSDKGSRDCGFETLP